MNELERKLELAWKEITRLKDENRQLKKLLAKHQIAISNHQNKHVKQAAGQSEILQKRTAIFKSLFKGRSDVYAVSWENRGSPTMHRHVNMKPIKPIKSGSCYR